MGSSLNTEKKVKKVVIVGGGTAGWMAAASISKLIGRNIEVTLVESDDIPTVGVGEATIPPLLTIHQLLNIEEHKFLAEVSGTFKLGISFEGWRDIGKDYIHSFGETGRDCWAAGFQHFWLKAKSLGSDVDYGDYCLELIAAKQNKFAHLPNGGLNYAYHMDAGLYAKLLKRIADEFGAKRIEGKIVSVQTDRYSGFIDSITLESGRVIEGDLFIDCSGFGGLLIEKALHTGYEDWSHWLPCDRAVAVQTKSIGDPVPYTRSIARPFGWQWRIPLQSRVGNGLVYCSKYLSDDEAVKQLLDNVDGEVITTPRVIKYRTGQRLKHWNKNCVALGLASGFIEPLESTSIHLIQKSIIRLLRLFPAQGIKQSDIDEFNQQTEHEVENIRDFIILHYHVTERCDTPFWQYCKSMSIPQTLEHRIKLFRETGKVFKVPNELFGENSWTQVMLGQGITPEQYHPIVDMMSREELDTFLLQIKDRVADIVSKLPTHSEFLAHFCPAKAM